jgi:hypothetical protein
MEKLSSSSSKVPRGKMVTSTPPQSPNVAATRRVSTVDLTGKSPTTSTTLVSSIPRSRRGPAFITFGHDASFPVKLHQLLSSCDERVIRWQPENDGKSFTILEGGAFERDFLPILYKNADVEMFGELLSLYGFQRVDNGTCHGAPCRLTIDWVSDLCVPSKERVCLVSFLQDPMREVSWPTNLQL